MPSHVGRSNDGGQLTIWRQWVLGGDRTWVGLWYHTTIVGDTADINGHQRQH